MILTTVRPTYFPSLQFFWQMAQCDVCVFTDHLRFSKGSGVTRSAPLSVEQTVLRIPVIHNQNRAQIATTQIDFHSDWKQKHLKTIHHLFHQLPFAYYYLPELNALFDEPHNALGDFLWRLQQTFVKWLHLPVSLMRSSQINFNGQPEQLIVEWCAQSGATSYMSENQTFEKGWIDREYLEKKGIRVSTFQPMPQSHLLASYRDFSILNFLLQFGPEAGYIIRQYLPARVNKP